MDTHHNLNVVEFLHTLASRGESVSLVGDQLQHRAPKGIEASATINTLRQHKTDITAWLRERAATETPHPLSQGQLGLWLDWQRDPETPIYNLVLVARLQASVQVEILHQAAQLLLDRHPALRTVYSFTAEQPHQQVQMHQCVDFAVINGTTWTEAEVQAWIETEADRPFDLTTGPLMRMRLLERATAVQSNEQQSELHRYLLHWTLHHIATDLFTLEILQEELHHCYRTLRAGEQPGLPVVNLTQRDFVRWEAETLHTHEERLSSFWQRQLGNEPELLNLPVTARTMQLGQVVAHSQSVDFSLDSQLVQQLRAYARTNRTTLYTLLLAVYQLLISRYTSQERFFVTSPTAVRELAGWANTVGYFVNPVLLCADLQHEASDALDFTTFLRRTQETVTAAMAHHLYPYHAMLRQWHRQVTADQLQQGLVSFVFNTFRQPTMDSSGIFSEILVSGQRHLQEPLTLFIFDSQERLSGRIVYHTSQFDPAFIKRMAEHFTVLLNSIVTNPNQRLCELPLLTPAERHQLLVEWNDTQVDYLKAQCIHQLFEAHVARTPDAVAVVMAEERKRGREEDKENFASLLPFFPSSCLTYAELNARANQLAHHLQDLGVGPDVLVGICVERSIEMVVGLLAILKAGGAYVPLDPSYPLERLAFMLQDANPPVLLTQAHLLSQLPPTTSKVICLDQDWAAIATHSRATPVSQVQAEHLAYVIYTSGSTGKPKGVMIPHANVWRLLKGTEEWYGFDASDVWTLFHSFAFDFSVWEMWGALCYGGRLVVVPYLVSRDPQAFYQLLCEQQVTVLNQTPSAFRQLIDTIEQTAPEPAHVLRYVIFGGEALEFESLRPWFRRYGDVRPQLVNMYGITETTVHVTYQPIQTQDLDIRRGSSRIGQAIPDLRLYIFDAGTHPVPIGVAGELYVGGAGLARGYLNRPELTAERFIEHPEFGRLYKTGDLCRWLADGNIEYIGRADFQVKLRGFRIELGEIENALLAQKEVREAVVLPREDTPGNKQLVAYIVGDAEQETLRRALAQRLPDYMVPSAFVLLDVLPLTQNGKLDRKALPMPDRAVLAKQGEEEVPQGAVEAALAAIWCEVLRLETVSRHANFFEVGGDSIVSLQVINQARTVGIHLKPRQIFEAQTIARLAAVAEVTTDSLLATPEETEIVTGSVPLLPIQHWFFAQHQVNVHHFNQAVLLEVEQRLEGELLCVALAYLLQQHDALRLRFKQDAQGAWQQAYAEIAGSVSSHKEVWQQEVARAYEEIDLSPLPPAEQQQVLQQTNQRLQRTLNISTGPLWRVALVHLGIHQPDRLLFVIHHLAVDLVSWRILLPDLWQIYAQLANHQTVKLPAKGTSYQAWAHYLQHYAQSEAVVAELPYWQALANQRIAPLPVDYALIAEQDTVASAALVKCSLSQTETEALLQEVPAVYHTQINDLLLTALVQSFAEWTGQTSLLIDLEGHGREDLQEHLQLANTVGWFTALFPHLLQLPSVEGVGGMGEAIQAIKEQNRQIPQRGIGYGLLRYLNPVTAPQLAHLPQAEVSFNYGGQFSGDTSMDTLGGEWDGNERLDYRFNINGAVVNGQLSFTWLYSQRCYHVETVECLAQGFITALQSLIAHCQSPEAGGYTPSDFPLAQLDAHSFAKLVEQISSFKQ